MNLTNVDYLRGSDLHKSKKIRIIGIVGKTLVQDIFSVHKLSLESSTTNMAYEIDHGISSTVIALQESLVTLDASQTVGLRLSPPLESRVCHRTVGVKNVVIGIVLDSLQLINNN